MPTDLIALEDCECWQCRKVRAIKTADAQEVLQRPEVGSTAVLGRETAACGCDICGRSREIQHIALLLPKAESESLLSIFEALMNEDEEKEMRLFDYDELKAALANQK